MADDSVKAAIDGVVKTIGFGIVSDFRELSDAMREISSDMRNNNRLLEQTNDNIADTNRTLTDFEKNTQRQREFRLNRQTEDTLERRSKLNGQRTEEMMQKILAAISELQRQVKMGGAGGAAADGEDGGGLAEAAAGGAALAGAGAFLKGAARIAGKAGLVGLGIGAVAAAGAGAAYLMGAGESGGEGESGGSLSPAGAASSGGTPNVAGEALAMGAGTVASTAAGPAAQAILDRTTKTARQKALAKISARVPSYLAKFGGRITTIIGLKSVPVFGALVGGYFSFSRFMSGDSWTSIGAEFAAGVAPDAGALVGGPAGYVAGVATTLSIQTYLICRDIYQEENAIDIKNGVVPNFDDLDMSERAQVVKAVGAYVEAYVNNLLGRSKTADATTGIKAGETTGAAMAGAPGAIPAADLTAPAAAPAATDTGGAQGGAPSGAAPPADSGATTNLAKDFAGAREAAGEVPTKGPAQEELTKKAYAPASLPGSSPSSPTEINPGVPSSSLPGVSPSDNMATLSTRSDQTSMYAGGDYAPILDYLANSEGADYNTQFGYQDTTGGRPLTDMTVTEVMEAQRKQTGSSAIGRYQFMKQTMLDGLNAGIISPDEKFTPETQDRFATWLIDSKRKGSKWRAGKMSNEDFGKALSQEWASVPNPYTGASYYGQGIKHDVGTLMNVIESAKGAPPMAEGGKITPLSADTPKAGRDLSVGLMPPKIEDDGGDKDTSEVEVSGGIDKRMKSTPSGSSKEKKKNMISSYSMYMSHLFGAMPREMMDNLRNETSSKRQLEDVMDPLS